MTSLAATNSAGSTSSTGSIPSGLTTPTITVRSSLTPRRGSAMPSSFAFFSRIARNLFKRGRYTFLRNSLLIFVFILIPAVLISARLHFHLTDEALTLRLDRASEPWSAWFAPNRTDTDADVEEPDEDAKSGDDSSGTNRKPPSALIAAPFLTQRKIPPSLKHQLPIPNECNEWRSVARDPSRLILYRRHFTSLDFTDWFVFVSMFTEAWHATKHTSRRRPVYVDVAANHARRWSNTYFLDRCLGWDGVCAEANPGYHQELRTQRHCALIDTCISDTQRLVNFSFTAAYGGVVRDGSGLKTWGVDGNKHATQRKFSSHFRGFRELRCTTLARELPRLGVNHVDFMSLDVEGHELPVLQGMDWSRTTVDVLVVENKRPQIQAFLENKGFRRYKGVLKDDIYIRKGSGYAINPKFSRWLKTVNRKDYRIHLSEQDKFAVGVNS